MKKLLSAALLACLVLSCCPCKNGGFKAPSRKGPWTVEQAQAWMAEQPWIVGCNYVPSYAINQFEFWQEESFDPEVIDRELALAESIGFNTVRIYLHEQLWYADAAGFKKRISQFMDIAENHGIALIITFFTNGGNHDREFRLGPQPQPLPGQHNSNWIPSPGRKVIDDPAQWPRLKAYVQDILRTYKNDDRVRYWCLCNEPENFKNGCDVKEFMPQVYKWAWEVRPSQPLSSPVWQRPGIHGTSTKLDLVSFVCTQSDIITFHCYSKPSEVKTMMDMLSRFERPMVCQEYLARTYGNTFEDVMPLLKERKVGAINRGLVNNKCCFHLPWGHKDGDPEPEVWFHDIFRSDYTPWSPDEVDFIRSMTGAS